MKPMAQLEQEIEGLRKTGFDLYERAEQWRAALEEIRRVNRDPKIAEIIQRNLYS